MSETSREASTPTGGSANESSELTDSTLAEDILLVLFQPNPKSGVGTIAGEGTLHYVLAGAALIDLSLGGHVRTGEGRVGQMTVEAVHEKPPVDRVMKEAWDYLTERPRSVHTALAATGPSMRGPLLDRLVERGDLRRRTRKTLGLIESSALVEGDNGRRAHLLDSIRATLVDGHPPTPHTAALAALLYGSGTLPQFDRDIPWSSAVISRAEQLKDGHWGAKVAATAVVRTLTTVIASSIIAVASASR